MKSFEPSPPPRQPVKTPARLSPVLAWCALAVAYSVYLVIFLPLLPADGSHLGHDYSLHLPNMMAGYFHFLANGPFSVPWFNPGQCGGVPFIADLNVAFYSLPQWLTFVVNPMRAIRWSFAIFAALGGIGFMLLLRQRFRCTWDMALVAGVLFLFNGFFVYRIAIGHLTFHAFALVPWIALFLTIPDDGADGPLSRPLKWLLSTIGCAVIYAYMFQSGMVHGILPATLSIAIIVLVHGYLHGYRLAPWILFFCAAILSVALSAQRLDAALAFLQTFPRSGYMLPGFESIPKAVDHAFRSVFFRPDAESGRVAMLNVRWGVRREEWEYGVGPLAGIAIVAGLAAFVFRSLRYGPKRPVGRTTLLAAAIVAGAAFVVLLNWFEPSWNALQKSLPIFGSASNQLRWFSFFIPISVLFAALALQTALIDQRARLAVSAFIVLGTIFWNATADKSYYLNQDYNGEASIAVWKGVTSAEDIPPVAEVFAVTDNSGHITGRITVDPLLYGRSAMFCYQPMFGYKLEWFTLDPLRPGSVFNEVAPGRLNLKNPACYLFPGENSCRPGDHFTVDQAEALFRFAQYQNFAFGRSRPQIAADYVNLLAFVGVIGSLAIAGICLLTRWLRPTGRL